MKKMGFWSLLAVVLGAQIGSGILILPSILAPFGHYTIYGWLISCFGASMLAITFANLCFRIPKTGGPHAYVKEAFGNKASFFTGWTYWLVSWVSTSVVVIACVGYLSPFLGEQTDMFYLLLEIALLTIITIINCVSVEVSGKLEFVLTLLKFLPLLIIPILTLPHFNYSNFMVEASIGQKSAGSLINTVSLLAFWGFIGIECATVPVGAVQNPKRNIPVAVILGALIAAATYLVNCIGIMGSVPGNVLATSTAPYVEFAKIASSSWNAEYIVAVIGFIICLGTLNAWTLTSGQIALGLADDKLLPSPFKYLNKGKSPVFNILVSYVGLIIILFITKQKSMSKQIAEIIDFSVISFLFVYLISSLSYLKLTNPKKFPIQFSVGVISALFCAWIISNSELRSIIISLGFTVSGFTMLPFLQKEKPQNTNNNPSKK